jgi:endoglucanase
MWDYHGGFGLFEEDGNGLFEHDLNVPLLEALDMVVPLQTEYEKKPDSTGFIMYDDFLAQTVIESSYSDGILDYFSRDSPNNGTYCIRWTGASQYRAIVFDIRPDRDMSQLAGEGYALDFMVRGDTSSISFDVRFIDSKTSDSLDLPWRMGITIDDRLASFDGTWQHLYIPLNDMQVKGAWYDDTWHNPPGDFDWADVDRFEIVPEVQALGSSQLWFDNIHVTNMDTAQVRLDTTGQAVPVERGKMMNSFSLEVFPNPTRGPFVLRSPSIHKLTYEVLDLRGALVLDGFFYGQAELSLNAFAEGIYLLRVQDQFGNQDQRKIILQH